VYYRVACEVYPEREITASIFYTETGARQEIDPLTIDDLRRLVEAVEPATGSGGQPRDQ
jgi:hypothetical protein